MHIDVAALGLVAVATVIAAVTLVTTVSLGARMLAVGDDRTAVSMPRRIAGWALFALAGLFILYGLYLVIPYFHH